MQIDFINLRKIDKLRVGSAGQNLTIGILCMSIYNNKYSIKKFKFISFKAKFYFEDYFEIT